MIYNTIMKIFYLDSIHSKIDSGYARIKKCLAYPGVYYIQREYNKERKDYEAYYIGRDGTFYSGLIPRILEYAKKKQIKIEVDYKRRERIEPSSEPNINLTLREVQSVLVRKAIDNQRGLIVSPTRTGKTVVMAGIISCFKDRKVLILSHTLDIVNQTYTKFKEYGLKNISIITGSKKNEFNDITIASIQTFAKFNPEIYSTYFDMIFVDEVHHAASNQYAKVLSEILAPIRVGFTATPLTDKKKELIVEGYFGQIIGRVTIDEASEMGILAIPKIKLIPVPVISSIKDLRNYKDIYREAIINSNVRNLLIAEEVVEKAENKMTTLILVKEIEHGLNLQSLCEKLNLKVKFVQGSTDSDQREKIKNALNDREYDCVIATVVWKEGVDIPSINCLINAIGGKSEIQTLQGVGRVLTITRDKKEAEIIDFLDGYKYLAEHTIQRLSIYVNSGWL